jgi:hypothetical protein
MILIQMILKIEQLVALSGAITLTNTNHSRNVLASRGALTRYSELQRTSQFELVTWSSLPQLLQIYVYRASPQGDWVFFSNPTDAESTSITEYTQQQAGNYDREHVYEVWVI